MAINGVNGTRFNPYAPPLGGARPAVGSSPAAPSGQPASEAPLGTATSGPAAPQDIAAAIKQDAASRATLVNSPQAPEGVDQALWSILTKEERGYFVKAGAMGPLTYGRASAPQPAPSAPIMRGGRLDIRA